MHATRALALVVTLVPTMLGCAGSTAPEDLAVSLNVVAPAVVDATEIRFALENQTDRAIGYSSCEGAFVFRLVGSQWTVVERAPALCASVYEPLAAGARREDVWLPGEPLVAGRYRIQVSVMELRGNRRGPLVGVQAPEFTIE